jgi:hypothetical protein
MNSFHHSAQPTEDLFLDPPHFASQLIPYIQQPKSHSTEYHEFNPLPSHAFLPTRENMRQNWHVANPSYSTHSHPPIAQMVPYSSSGLEAPVAPAGVNAFQAHSDGFVVPVRPETPDEDPSTASEVPSSAASTPRKRRPKQSTQPMGKRQRTSMHP